VGGEDLAEMNDAGRTRLRKTTVSFVFQKFNLLPNLTARDNIALARYLSGKNGAKDYSESPEFQEVLKVLGIAHRLDHKPAALSGGEQQRVAIARALINDPLVLIADEPTGNLDPDLSAEILQIFAEANLRGSTVLVATHDRDLIRSSGRRVITLEHGRIGDEKARVLEAPAVREGLFGIGG
jgi:ABC-type lipoprotein export system ATPase subunit